MRQKKNSLLTSSSVYIIAEMACSHEGDVVLGQSIIDAAGSAEANAIQFQVWSLSDMVVPHHPAYEMLSSIELSRDSWTNLFHYARKKFPEMEIIACVYERGSVDFCESLGIDAYKIHSADLSNPYLIKHIARTGKPIDLSVGASTLNEIQTAVEWIGSSSESPIWLMYGYQDFPTKTDDVHLRYMMNLKRLFGLPVGYQDHSDAETEASFWLPAVAVGMGIDVLEKHITHDRSLKGVDHEAALNPQEFSSFVGMVREIECALGVSTPKEFSKNEIEYRRSSKKSLVAARALDTGTILTEKDFIFMRAETLGVPPDKAHWLIGKKLKNPIAAFHLILYEDLE